MTTMNLDGNDIEDALTIIEQNGGSGDWEEPTDETEGVQRWLFPRFPNAENIGTCSDEDGNVPSGHEGNHMRSEDCGENFAADPGNMYLSRTGLGPYDTDVETIVAWLNSPRNVVGGVLLLSEPGAGKTALIEAAVTHSDRDLLTVLCTPDHTKDSLFLRFVGEGKGDCIVHGHEHVEGADDFDNTCVRSPYTLGPIPYACKYGKTLYLDEYFMLVDGVKPVTYSLMDGRRFLPEGNVDGSPMEIHEDFRIVLSSNPMVRGASLPEPVGSRCAGTTMHVETSAPMLRDLGIDEAIVAAWEGLGSAGLWRPQIREMRVADYWLAVNPAQAVSAFLGEHCPESQRKQVRNTVVSNLGGQIREDGRMVVS